ncbi:Nitrogen regulation protein NR(I) [Lysobacter dokdonensis DS-58]|uniref:Nitrogen regulation protein NR(I) n=1 Tax=Lysobacter dokdonensis DS-58 TaxID=1300345 RepID=A0A0A2WJS3_9GAMM|nr:response regulator [Lysobacter dokdonensis]KGQ20048.1 Nitrogen regulation protein NR(I) [Lysobacter dokdonensis DS-58]
MNDTAAVVHLVDNDPRVLKSVARLLASVGIETRASTSTDEFLAHYDADVPGCVVLDLAMPGRTGLDLQRSLQDRHVDVPIVFLTGCADVPTSVRAMKAGALDFLVKPVDGDALIAAVRDGIAVDRRQRERIDADRALHERLSTLTPREHELLPHLISGKLNKQIAADLGVVEKTVKVHRAHVMQKLGVRRLADLVRLASRASIEPSDAPRPIGPTAN